MVGTPGLIRPPKRRKRARSRKPVATGRRRFFGLFGRRRGRVAPEPVRDGKESAQTAAELAEWQEARAKELALAQAILEERLERQQRRDEKRRAAPPVAGRDFAARFVDPRYQEQPKAPKVAWGAERPTVDAVRSVGCFD